MAPWHLYKPNLDGEGVSYNSPFSCQVGFSCFPTYWTFTYGIFVWTNCEVVFRVHTTFTFPIHCMAAVQCTVSYTCSTVVIPPLLASRSAQIMTSHLGSIAEAARENLCQYFATVYRRLTSDLKSINSLLSSVMHCYFSFLLNACNV